MAIAEVARAGGNRVAAPRGQACRADGLLAASRIAAAAGIRVYVDTCTTRLAHGARLPEFPRLECYSWPALRQRDGVTHLITTGTQGCATPGVAVHLSRIKLCLEPGWA